MMQQLSSRHHTPTSHQHHFQHSAPLAHWCSQPAALHPPHYHRHHQQQQYMSSLATCASNSSAGAGQGGFDTAAYDKQRLRLDQQVGSRLLPHGTAAQPVP
jgi:hypothetical protein